MKDDGQGAAMTKDLHRFAIGWMLVLLGAASFVHEPAHHLLFGKSFYSAEAVLPLPDAGLELVLDRRQNHLFLAEYERTLILRDPDGEVFRFSAAGDSGGNSRMSVYRISRFQFYLEGTLDFDRYVLDVAKPSIAREVVSKLPPTAQLIGTFDRDKQGWRFISAQSKQL